MADLQSTEARNAAPAAADDAPGSSIKTDAHVDDNLSIFPTKRILSKSSVGPQCATATAETAESGEELGPSKRLCTEASCTSPAEDRASGYAEIGSKAAGPSTVRSEAAGGVAQRPAVRGGFGELASQANSGGFAFGTGTFNTASGGFGSVGQIAASRSPAVGEGLNSGAQAVALGPKVSKNKQTEDSGAMSVASTAATEGMFGSSIFSSGPNSCLPVDGAVDVFGASKSTADAAAQLGQSEKVYTGEEEDTTLFSCKASLYKLDSSDDKTTWKQRGVGVLRVNVQANGKARLVMRQTGILRLILNAWIYPELKLHRIEGQPRVSFLCINSVDRPDEGDAESANCPIMQMYTLKLGSLEKLEWFIEVVEKHRVPQLQSEDVVSRACEEVDAIAASICNP